MNNKARSYIDNLEQFSRYTTFFTFENMNIYRKLTMSKMTDIRMIHNF